MIIRQQRREAVLERLRQVWEDNYTIAKPTLLKVPPFAPLMSAAKDQRRPAVAVGAGPSLVQNVDDLNPELYDIVACDKVVPFLLEHGKKPKFVVALNSEPTNVKEWLRPILKDPEVTLIVPCVVWPETWIDADCNIIFLNNELGTGLHSRIFAETGHPPIAIGSNAGTFAYLSACYTAHNPVAYIGMNFSFWTKEEILVHQSPDDYNLIEFYRDGRHNWLTVGWLDMAEAFQEDARAMAQWFGIRTFNATEGGINYSKFVTETTLKDFNAMLMNKKMRTARTGIFYGGR